jgi:N-acyl-D-aspartate/D-glutamate deacylase
MDNLLQPMFEQGLSLIYPLTDPLDYEPTPDRSFAARAAAERRDPFEYYYDFLLGDNGRAVAMYISANYSWGNLDPSGEMLSDPNSVLGLSDAGAHVSFLCDSNMPTFALQHWVRDRRRGPRLSLELAVNKTTDAVARLYGLADRGSITPGKRADLNVIDFDNLTMSRPELHHDLPAGGGRFLQEVRGYLATFVCGEQTRSGDKDTGARPGRVARRTA